MFSPNYIFVTTYNYLTESFFNISVSKDLLAKCQREKWACDS